MNVKVGLGTSTMSSPARARMSARANVVLPAPRSPDSVTRSPGSSAVAISAAKRSVASSFGNITLTLEPPAGVKSIKDALLFGGRQRDGFAKRKGTGHGRAPPHNRSDIDSAAMQFHERAD